MRHLNIAPQVTEGLLRKYDWQSPYYTSYPSGKVWSGKFDSNYAARIARRYWEAHKEAPAALYFHIPYCSRLCRFCFCYTSATREPGKIDALLDLLLLELRLWRRFFEALEVVPNIREIHLGGGSPSCLSETQFARLVEHIRLLVEPGRLEEFTTEVDAVNVSPDKLRFFSSQGITRLSFGIQDFDPLVQEAIGRVQTPSLIERILTANVRDRFKSVNFDLMYGLPHQSRRSFARTIDHVLKLAPDRIALYSYFHMPELYKHQAAIRSDDLPPAVEKTMIFVDAAERLSAGAYELVGVDHFARGDDDLARAALLGTLQRHFMGYTPGRVSNLIGLGPSSLASLDECYLQNRYGLDEYQASLARDEFPVFRGHELSRDDIIRRAVINELMCYLRLDTKALNRRFGIDFDEYFNDVQDDLAGCASDGLLERTSDAIKVTPLGWLFLRQMSSLFDAYLDRGCAGPYRPSIQRSRNT